MGKTFWVCLASGLWTMGITWGLWITPQAQRLASRICLGIGLIVAVIGVTAIVGFRQVDPDRAEAREFEMYQQRVRDGSILPNPHKLIRPIDDASSDPH